MISRKAVAEYFVQWLTTIKVNLSLSMSPPTPVAFFFSPKLQFSECWKNFCFRKRTEMERMPNWLLDDYGFLPVRGHRHLPLSSGWAVWSRGCFPQPPWILPVHPASLWPSALCITELWNAGLELLLALLSSVLTWDLQENDDQTSTFWNESLLHLNGIIEGRNRCNLRRAPGPVKEITGQAHNSLHLLLGKVSCLPCCNSYSHCSRLVSWVWQQGHGTVLPLWLNYCMSPASCLSQPPPPAPNFWGQNPHNKSPTATLIVAEHYSSGGLFLK